MTENIIRDKLHNIKPKGHIMVAKYKICKFMSHLPLFTLYPSHEITVNEKYEFFLVQMAKHHAFIFFQITEQIYHEI